MASLKDLFEESYAQINPFDRGKTAQTVKRQRGMSVPAQTVSQPKNSLLNNPVTRGLSRTFDQANPFDNNRTWQQRTATQSKSNRQQLGQIGGQTARTLIGNTARLVNTANLQGRQVANTAKMYAADITNNDRAWSNANRASQNDYNRFSNKGGILNVGTVFKSPEEAARGDFKTGATRIGGGFLGAASEILPFTRGGSMALRGVAAKKAVPRLIAENTAYSAAGSVGNQLLQDGNVNAGQLAKDIATGNAMGLGAFGAARGAQSGVQAAQRATRQRLVNMAATPSGIKNIRTDKLVGEDLQGYGDLDPSRVEYYKRELQSGRKPAAIIALRGDDGRLYVEDGKNRLQAHKELGLGSVPTKVVSQKQLQAIAQGGYVALPTGKTATQTAPPPTKPPEQALAAPAGDMEPPKQNTITESAGNKQKSTRYASKTVPESEFVSEQVRQDVKAGAPQYDVQTERARYTNSLSRLKSQGDEAFEQDVVNRLQKEKGQISSQDVADTQTYAAILDAKGDPASLQKATELYSRLSEHLTAAGQTVQAAAILSRRTPEGLRYWATKQLREGGVEPSPELQTQLKRLIDATKDAKNRDRAVYEVQRLVSNNIPSSMGDRIINLWRAGLLTAPTTTGGNLLGNTGETLVRKGFVNPVATAADAAIGLFTGKRTQTLAPSGLAAKGAIEGTKKLPEYIKTGFDERNATSKYEAGDINYGNSPAGKAIGAYVNGVYRLMSVADQPYWYAARNEALGSIAKAEAINNRIPSAKRKSYIAEFMKNPPTNAIERATAEAMYATFQNRTILGDVASGLKRGAGKAKPIADFFIPFTQVPASIATRIVERTPVGVAANAVKQFLEVRKGGQFDQRALSQAIANGSFGPAVFAAGYALANSGLLTFGYPEDAKERELWEAEGKQPYSVKVGNRWYSLNYMQPFGTLLAIGGQAKQAVKEGSSPAEVIAQGIATAGQSIMGQSFLKGVSGVLDAVDDPKRYAEDWVENTTASSIPNFIRSATRAADPFQREVSGVKEGLQAAIPGLRDDLPAKQDIAGNDLPAKDNFANQFLNPLKPSIARDSDQIVQELRRLQDTGNGVIPAKIQKNSLGDDTELTKDQIRELQANVSKKVNSAWNELTGKKEYSLLSDEDKSTALRYLSSDIAAVEKQAYAAKNQLGQYSPNYTGNPESLKTRQVAIQNGNLDVSTYTRSGSTSNKTTLKDDSRGTALLDKVGTFTRDQRSNWENSQFDTKYQDLYDRANQIRFEGLPDIPQNNKVLGLYADLLEKRSKGMTPLAENKAKLAFLKSAYKTDLSQESQEILSASTNDILNGIDAGYITRDQVAEAIRYDDILVGKGLSSSPDIANKVRRALGFSVQGKSGSSSGGGGKSKVYNLYGSYNPVSTTKMLRDLVSQATLRS